MKNLRKILVPVDLSTSSIAALEYGITMAKLFGAKLYLLHVMDKSPYEILSRTCSVMDELYDSVEKNIKSELNQCIEENMHGEIEDVINLVRCGVPEKEIVALAESEDIDLIVMTDRTIIYRTERENITKKVMRSTDIPVVIINPEGFVRKKTDYSPKDNQEKKKSFGEDFSSKFLGIVN